MGSISLIRTLGAVLLLGAVAAGGHASDTGLTEREERLLEVIERLESRVDELEDKVRDLERRPAAPVPAPEHLWDPELVERVEALEAREDDLPELDPRTFQVYWDDTIRMRTADDRFNLAFHGRFQLDFSFFDQPRDLQYLWNPVLSEIFFENAQDGVEFRSAWFGLHGRIYDNMSFQLQWNFAKNRTAQIDTFVAFHEIPAIGNLRIGRFREPFTLEEQTALGNVTFHEAALPSVFSPGYQTGMEVYNTAFDDRMTWQLALTYTTDSAGDGGGDGSRNVTGRVTGLPYYADDGRRLLHLGAAYSYRNLKDTLRYRKRPESNRAPFFLDTGEFYARDNRLLGLEAAGVWGPFSFQSEYIRSDVNTRLAGSRSFDGWYVETAYFLTGEHLPYNRSRGFFGGVKPRRNFNQWDNQSPRGWGAWQVAARYSTLDLDDGPIRGGSQENWTLGVNWFVNPLTRISLNYIRADVDHSLYWGDMDILQMRVQLRF